MGNRLRSSILTITLQSKEKPQVIVRCNLPGALVLLKTNNWRKVTEMKTADMIMRAVIALQPEEKLTLSFPSAETLSSMRTQLYRERALLRKEGAPFDVLISQTNSVQGNFLTLTKVTDLKAFQAYIVNKEGKARPLEIPQEPLPAPGLTPSLLSQIENDEQARMIQLMREDGISEQVIAEILSERSNVDSLTGSDDQELETEEGGEKTCSTNLDLQESSQ
jgi:hypothetical protein